MKTIGTYLAILTITLSCGVVPGTTEYKYDESQNPVCVGYARNICSVLMQCYPDNPLQSSIYQCKRILLFEGVCSFHDPMGLERLRQCRMDICMDIPSATDTQLNDCRDHMPCSELQRGLDFNRWADSGCGEFANKIGAIFEFGLNLRVGGGI